MFRVGIFYASASLSGAFGGEQVIAVTPPWRTYERRVIGLLASVIIKMDGVGGLTGWRWIFILEGIATVIIAFIAWGTMPADLQSAKFFTDEERQFASQLISRITYPANDG